MRLPRALGAPALSLVSLYARLSPVQKGKWRLYSAAAPLIPTGGSTVRTAAGRRFSLSFPRDRGWEVIYFGGTYERGTTHLVERVVRPGDVALDIGANIGWYTVLLGARVGAGVVHAFEPVPPIFEELRENCRLNDVQDRVRLNNLALGEHPGTVDLHTFAGSPHGHSSQSTLGRDDYTAFRTPVVRLDDYLEESGTESPAFIKMDVEGAEMNVLRGAERLLSSQRPPMWVLEMNRESAGHFGHAPEDLLTHLQRFGEHRFFRVVRAWGRTLRMRSVTDYEHGDNVLCVPAARLDRVAGLG